MKYFTGTHKIRYRYIKLITTRADRIGKSYVGIRYSLPKNWYLSKYSRCL